MTVRTTTVDFNIPVALYEQGLVDAYAKTKGYQLKLIEVNEEGEPLLSEAGEPTIYDNPQSAEDYIAEGLRNQLQQEFKNFIKVKAVQEAQLAAEKQFNTLLGSDE